MCIRLVFQWQNNIDMRERGRTVKIIIITVKIARQLELSQQFCLRLKLLFLVSFEVLPLSVDLAASRPLLFPSAPFLDA